mmetsp:Transcript_7076/g.8148  ORF Transcript_7076/g.8148 Transcript_7076/m.8148 type:complete len:205 (-) Transcript_7076:398-1012(-)|eukprot:CAMPEP_0197859438 /NCGR_PEP_ID=MMETSP1438-20131217/33976_1 /TAXON_ID=1461541 /ORGANISM="Pterosperma sp., Strain CCMP1384" /LENGTH=204 /DNA_ID=CAMNT_0043475917 /DNA_START=69 /DNA_END=683 /DNA_ORIENTATION=+
MASFTCARVQFIPKASVARQTRSSVAAKSLTRSAFTPAKFARASFKAQSPARSLLVVKATDERLSAELEKAIKVAKECTDDCAVEWDLVEELSAEAGHQSPPEPTEPTPLAPEVVESMKATVAAIAEAQSKATATADATEYLKAAQVELGKVVNSSGNTPSEKVQRLEAALEEALKVANDCEEDCAPDWDAVEEISAAVDKAKK